LHLQIPFAKGFQELDIDEQNLIMLAEPPLKMEAAADEGEELKRGFAHPIGTPRLRELARKGQKVAIAVSDYTRSTPTKRILPFVLGELFSQEISDDDITIIFAGGNHRQTNEQEAKAILGEYYDRFQIRVNEADNDDVLKYVGTTSTGIEVEANKYFVDADLKISLGTVEPHHSAGYSGGAKNLLPGVCSRKTINQHHELSRHPLAMNGKIEGNPFKEQIDEAGRMIGCDFLVNVSLTEDMRINQVFTGDLIQAHRTGAAHCAKFVMVDVPVAPDIVVVSLGGSPRDANLYQAEGKGLNRVKDIVKEGGVIILVADCYEGIGHAKMEEYLKMGSPQKIVDYFGQAEFSVPGNKAWRVGKMLLRNHVFLVTSTFTDDVLPLLPLKNFRSLQDAFDQAMAMKGADAQVLVVPRSVTTVLKNSKM